MEYYVLDTETTGLKAGYHEVIEISIIRCKDGEQKTVFIKANFPKRANVDSLAIQNKTAADLSCGLNKPAAIKIIEDFILEDKKTPAHRCIIGHCIAFDRRFLYATWESENKLYPADLWLCTKSFMNRYIKKTGMGKQKLGLENSLKIIGIPPVPGAHKASVDARNTFELFNKLMEQNIIQHVSLIKNVPHTKKE